MRFKGFAVALVFFYVIFNLVFSAGRLQAQTNISNSPNLASTSPRISVDSRGNVHAIWVEMTSGTTGDLYYSRGSKNLLSWTSPINLSQSNKVYCESLMMADIDVDSSDRVYVVWTEGNMIKLRIYADNVWGGTIDVGSGSSLDAPKISVSPEGDIFIVWWPFSGQVYCRARINGVWENSQLISDSGKRSKFPDIAVGKNKVAACWVEKNGDLYQAVYVERNRSFNASWSSIIPIAPSNLSQQQAVVELDSADIAHVVWTPVISEDGTRRVDYSSGGLSGFSSPQSISETMVLHYPAIDEKNNNIYSCWQVGVYGNGSSVDYNIKAYGSWIGAASVKGSSGVTFCDLSVSKNEDIVYFIWDANGEIYVRALPGPGIYFYSLHFDGHDFNGDGLSDIGVFRPADGYWYFKDMGSVQWGQAGDIPVNGDYNGDGKTDIAVWRYSDGRWYVKDMANEPWGTVGDIPVPGKYNTDATTDMAVWRIMNGSWYIKNIGTIAWGTRGDIPVPADYNGDGKTDVAVWRPAEGIWYIQNIGTFQWGVIGDIPVPADYDGDGKADIAVWRPSEGIWYVRHVGSFAWGVEGDIPVPGKYNYNSGFNIAVWRPSSGIWYILNVGFYQWGAAGDIPIIR